MDTAPGRAAKVRDGGGQATMNVLNERELKVVLADDHILPIDQLAQAVPGAVLEGPERRRIRDVYHDTEDLRLARWGVTLRWRTGAGWTVKLPGARRRGGLDRAEITVEGKAGRPPAEVVGLVRSYTRSAPLIRVAELRSDRLVRTWRSPDGSMVAELSEDTVVAKLGTRADTKAGGDGEIRFCELEVELAPEADPAVLETCLELLGLDEIPPSVPKLIRVLGPDATAAADVDPPALGPDPTGAEVIRAALARSVAQLITELPAVRLGLGPEGVHQARVATRRLRSDLRTFAPLLDRDWADHLRDELAWLADELGRVRDADVLDGNLRPLAAAHPHIDPDAVEAVLEMLRRQRDADRAQLLAHLDDDRAPTLLDHLVEAAAAPRTAPEADAPAADVLPDLVHKTWRRLKRAVRALPADPPIADLHRIRILAKRVRYASEAVAPALGRPATRFARQAAEIQESLGLLNDAEVAGRWLAGAAGDLPGPAAFAAGQMAQEIHRRSTADEAAWRPAYDALHQRRSWLTSGRRH